MIEEIVQKKKELASLIFAPQDEERLWKKFSLEWNYNSNHIEGNTLTYGETELLLIHGKVSGTHSVRDIEEMKAHDLAIKHLRKMTKEDRKLTEGDIRDFNTILLKESFFKDAITPDGRATRIEIKPGEYKTQPNNVRLPDGDIFEFTSPQDVAVQMQELLAWLEDAIQKGKLHPIEIVTKLHHDFVCIHPFGDGNGRTARLLMNYVLLKSGYPPIIVKTTDKEKYLAALQKADAGESDGLRDFFAECLIWSLDRSIRAAKGEAIEDEDDLDKEVAVFIKNQTSNPREEVKFGRSVFSEICRVSLAPLLERLEEKCCKFDPLFGSAHSESNPPFAGGRPDILASLKQFCSSHADVGKDFFWTHVWKGYLNAEDSFGLQVVLWFRITPFYYEIELRGAGGFRETIQKAYSDVLLDREISNLAKSLQTDVFNVIKQRTA